MIAVVILSVALCLCASQGQIQSPAISDPGISIVRKCVLDALGLAPPRKPGHPRAPHGGRNGHLRGPFPPGVKHTEPPGRLFGVLENQETPPGVGAVVRAILPYPSFLFADFVPAGTLLFDLAELPGDLISAELFVHHRGHQGSDPKGHRPSFNFVESLVTPKVQLIVVSEKQQVAHLVGEYPLTRPEPNHADWHRIDLRPALAALPALPAFLGVRVVDSRGRLALDGSRLQPSPVFLVLGSPDSEEKPRTVLDSHELALTLLYTAGYNTSALSIVSSGQEQDLRRQKRCALEDLVDPAARDQVIVRRLASRRQRKPRRARACRVHELFINFTRLFWDKWIIWPKELPAQFCSGSCRFGSQEAWSGQAVLREVVQRLREEGEGGGGGEPRARYSHSYTAPRRPARPRTCTPSGARPFKVMYMEGIYRFAVRTYPDMIVDQCSCNLD